MAKKPSRQNWKYFKNETKYKIFLANYKKNLNNINNNN